MDSPGTPVLLPRTGDLPTTLRAAAVLLVAYGIVVLVNATVLQMRSDWEGVSEYPRAIVRAVGMAVLAWGLLRRLRWFWWLAVGLALFWIVTAMAGVALIRSLGTAETDPILAPGFYWTLALTTALLTAAVVLLLLPSSRAAFRRSAI
jgi:hypothetical protein